MAGNMKRTGIALVVVVAAAAIGFMVAWVRM